MAALGSAVFFIRALWLYFNKPDDTQDGYITAECIEEDKPNIKAE